MCRNAGEYCTRLITSSDSYRTDTQGNLQTRNYNFSSDVRNFRWREQSGESIYIYKYTNYLSLTPKKVSPINSYGRNLQLS